MGRWGTQTYVNCRYVSLGHSANCAYLYAFILLFYIGIYMHLEAFVLSLTFALQHPPPLNKEERERALRFLFLYKPFSKDFIVFFNFPHKKWLRSAVRAN